MAAIFGFGGGTNFLLGVALAEDGQRSFASCKCDDVHGYLMCFFVHVLSCSIFIFIFGTHVIIQTRDIIKGVLVGNEAKEAKIQKNIKQTKRWQKMESLQKGCLKINESGKTRNREPEVVSLQNDARKRYLKSQLLKKRSSSRIQHSYHEESCHLIKWYTVGV